MPTIKKIYAKLGSPAFNINQAEIQSVLRGIVIAIGGVFATEITKWLSGSDIKITWDAFNVGPFVFVAGSKSITPILWIVWSGVINFVRKYILDNSDKSA